jgi:hypothetical protein
MTHAWLGLLAGGLAATLAGAGAARAEEAAGLPAMPMPVDRTRTADARWLAKPVLETRILDDMSMIDRWSHRGQGKLEFLQQRPNGGVQVFRLVSPTVAPALKGASGRPSGEAALRFDARGEDWTPWNRLSIWVYPRLPGFKVISLLVKLSNDGVEKLPGSQTRGALHYVILQPDKWNHVVWEIPHLTRDKVTAVEFIYRLQGNEPGATREVSFDFERLELQKVQADPFEGWAVAPGRIAFSHTGYLSGGRKSAIASGLSADQFSVIDVATGKEAYRGTPWPVKSRLGEFQVMDFSTLSGPGTYAIRAGTVKTGTFRIAPDVWRETIIKTINFFFCERCGYEVPGAHGVCHQDWQGVHGDKKIAINGGWHDAGDLSQGLVNTGEAVAAMLELAERLRTADPALSRRLMEEARWGLDWILKTRFGDGFRVTWATMDYWTDNQIGTADDTVAQAQNSPMENFLGAAAEAMAARVLKASDPAKAAECLAAARDDWKFAVEKAPSPPLELASYAALASVEMFKATGEKAYADKAAEFARIICDCQQRTATDWKVPLVGFFYTSPKKDRLLHYFHRGHENAPIQALAELCEAAPDHADWMTWYSAVVLHSEYLRASARFTEPYGMLPASVYRIDESNDPYFKAQVAQGIEVAPGHYLRLFPVWWDFRGNHGTVLSQTKALSAAARLRRNKDLADLCQVQLEWVVGRNPFGQSTMYGEGYDYAPQYTAMSGDMAGSLPVGIQTLREHDVPYWPVSNCYNYKEVWVHPSSRWLAILGDLAMPRPGESPRRPYLFGQGRAEDSGGRSVRLEVAAAGSGRARFTIRAENLKIEKPDIEVQLEPKTQTFTRDAEVIDLKQPWVAVIIPDGRPEDRQEVFGGLPPLPKP